IRDRNVTGVQTCALPISTASHDNGRSDLVAAEQVVPDDDLVAARAHADDGDPGPDELLEPLDIPLRRRRQVLEGAGPGDVLRPEIGRAACRERSRGTAGE